jgi:hypothetical protein
MIFAFLASELSFRRNCRARPPYSDRREDTAIYFRMELDRATFSPYARKIAFQGQWLS